MLDHDIALSMAPDTLHTAAALAGLAFDANRLLAVSEGRLAEARRLGERLLGADIAMRAEMEELLDEGPIARLRTLRIDLYFGAPIDSVVESIRQATAEVRELSHGLYPPELIEGGLGAVVGDRRGAPRRRLPAAVEVTAFRLVTDDPDRLVRGPGTMLRVHVRRRRSVGACSIASMCSAAPCRTTSSTSPSTSRSMPNPSVDVDYRRRGRVQRVLRG